MTHRFLRAARWLLPALLMAGLAAGLGGGPGAALAAPAAGRQPAGSTAPNLVMNLNIRPLYPRLGSPVYLTSQVNNTSGAGTHLVMTTTVSGLLQFQGADVAGWNCLSSVIGTIGLTSFCHLPSLAGGASTGVTYSMTAPLTPGSAYYTATATSTEPDVSPPDNTNNTLVAAFAHSANGNPWDLADAQSVPYSIASGSLPDSGEVGDGGQDAFDGFGQLRVRLLDFPPINASISNLDLTYSDGGHWRTVTPNIISELQVSRRIDAPPGADWIRYIDTFTNTDGEFPAHVLVMWGGNLGSDNQTATRDTTDHDALLESSDTWAVTVQQSSPDGPAEDAPVGYAFRSPADTTYQGPYLSDLTPFTTTVWPSSGNDRLGHVFDITIGPSNHQELMYFVYRGLAEQAAGPVDCQFYADCVVPATGAQVTLADNTVAALVANPPVCDLSPAELSKIVNWPGLTQRCMFVPLVGKN